MRRGEKSLKAGILGLMLALGLTACSQAPSGDENEDEIPVILEDELEEQDDSSSEEEDTTIYIQYEIAEEQASYYIYMSDPLIYKDGDSYSIKGDMGYAGAVVLTWEQKALLDAGAVLQILYKDNVVAEVTSDIEEFDSSPYHYPYMAAPYVIYRNPYYFYMEPVTLDTTNLGREDKWIVENLVLPYVDLASPPYNGLGFFFREEYVYSGPLFTLVLEEDVTLTVPGDTEIFSGSYLNYLYAKGTPTEEYELAESKDWTVAEFYELGEDVLRNIYSVMEVFTENGEVVKLIHPYRP